VRQDGERISVEHGHGQGDVAISGPAASLLLMLVRRRPDTDEDLTVYGNRGLLSDWLDRTPY
jgi:predicted lipid carrier protein YhbT